MNKRIIQTGSLAVLLFAGGCSNDSNLVPEPAAGGEITIQTRADKAEDYRLLVFNAAEGGACVLNQVIAGGAATTLSLVDGEYQFVTLTGAGQFYMPEAGKTDGLTFSGAITLKQDQPLSPVNISRKTKITIPTDPVYVVELLPATCMVELVIKNKDMFEDDCTFSLTNMNNGFRPDGADPATISHTLVAGDNVCFPTKGEATLSYQFKSAETQIEDAEAQTLDLGQAFEAGKSYTVTLTYKEGFTLSDLEIKDWDDTGNTHGGDAVLP
ncbi:hypothetical protein [Parabacteroides sp.]